MSLVQRFRTISKKWSLSCQILSTFRVYEANDKKIVEFDIPKSYLLNVTCIKQIGPIGLTDTNFKINQKLPHPRTTLLEKKIKKTA